MTCSDLPLCPRCDSKNVRKASTKRRLYYCRDCERSWVEGARHRTESPKLQCYYCGSTVARLWATKPVVKAKCGGCGHFFTQGGPQDIRLNATLVLKPRVSGLHLPPELEEEVYQQAVADVLEGHGYCSTIPLDVIRAKKTVYGNYQSYKMQRAYHVVAEGESVAHSEQV